MVGSEAMKFLLRHFLQPPFTSFLFDIKMFLSTLFWNIFSVRSSLNVKSYIFIYIYRFLRALFIYIYI